MPALSYVPDGMTASILDVMPQGIAIHDLRGQFLYINRWLQDLLGYPDKCWLMGRRIEDIIYPGELEEVQVAIHTMMQTEQPLRVDGARMLKSSGDLLYVDITAFPFHYQGQRAIQVIVTDATARQQAQEALLQTEERFRKSLALANVGAWDLNFAAQTVTMSEKVGPMFGMPEGTLSASLDEILAAVHPHDVAVIQAAIQRAVDEDNQYEAEYRTLQQDGSFMWLFARGAVVRDAQGQPANMMGTVQEISEIKLLQADLQSRNATLQLTQAALTRFVLEQDFTRVADRILADLLTVTESEYGFLCEVSFGQDHEPVISLLASRSVSHPGEDARAMAMSFNNLDALYGAVVTTGKVVCSNDMQRDSRSVGMPAGHPQLYNFLGIPVFHAGKLVGVYGLSNRENGYDEEIVKNLELFNACISVIIYAQRIGINEKKILRDLQQAKDEAIQANRAKSDFLSSMSHEFRTPLNAILGFAQLLQMDDEHQLSREQLSNVREIIHAGQFLLTLVSDILDLSRIEAGRMQIKLQEFDPGSILHESYALLRPLAEKAQVDICLDADFQKLPSIMADETRLLQVLINLVSNAIKYNRKGGRVWLETRRINADGILRISVHDTGVGIPENLQGRLFNSFERLGKEQTGEGSGIGLVISKRLARMMSGDVGFSSKENVGSVFWVDIPLA